MRRVRVGVQIAQYGTSFSALVDAARELEAMGVDAVFNWDHFFGPGPDADVEHFECWAVLAAWAAATSRIELGPLVSAIGYRNPDLVADMARTLDHLSGGRVMLGLGAGFKERDYAEYGYPFGAVGGRLRDLEQGLLRIERRLATLNPPPVRPIPLLVGGSGEQRTLRIVARHADIWHTFAEGDAFERKSRILDDYCLEIGRDPALIERSVLVAGDPLSVGQPLRELGASLFIVSVSDRPSLDLAPVDGWLSWRDDQNRE
jgi:probable F420-dependent oxidoreductase